MLGEFSEPSTFTSTGSEGGKQSSVLESSDGQNRRRHISCVPKMNRGSEEACLKIRRGE